MSRFDLYPGSGSIDYYLDVQATFHAHLATRVVVPIIAAGRVKNPTRGLHVALTIHGADYYLVTPMLAAVPARSLGKPIDNLESQSYTITAAIDFLLQGF